MTAASTRSSGTVASIASSTGWIWNSPDQMFVERNIGTGPKLGISSPNLSSWISQIGARKSAESADLEHTFPNRFLLRANSDPAQCGVSGATIAVSGALLPRRRQCNSVRKNGQSHQSDECHGDQSKRQPRPQAAKQKTLLARLRSLLGTPPTPTIQRNKNR